MSLAGRIDPSWIAVDLEVSDQPELFAWVTGKMAETGFLDQPEAAAQKLLDREKIVSTAICPGVAVPHARCDDAKGVGMCVIRLAQPMEFAARDGHPVRLIFALLGPPEATAEHVRVLGQVARLIQDRAHLDSLLNASSAEDLLVLLES